MYEAMHDADGQYVAAHLHQEAQHSRYHLC